MVARLNEERGLRSLPPLQNDALLAAVARAHSQEMRALSYFAHESPTPGRGTFSERHVLAFNATPRYLCENIWKGNCRAWIGPKDVFEQTVRGWMKKPLRPTREDIDRAHKDLMGSSGHAANVLRPEPTRVGIGLIFHEGDIWITQLLVKP